MQYLTMFKSSRISDTRPKLNTLGLTFALLTICGFWRPPSWSFSICKRFVYKFYMVFNIFLVATFCISQFVAIFVNTDYSNDIADDIYIFLEVITGFFKMLSFVINGNGIARLMDLLARDPLVSLDDEEETIRVKFEKLIRFSTRGYMSLVEASLSSYILLSLAIDFRKQRLTFRSWLPFDNTFFPIFCVTYVHQILGLLLSGMAHIALDTLIYGFFLKICCQFEILETRLKRITNERRTIVRLCVRQHESIYKFAENVNQRFQFIIFIQFVVSTWTVCFTLYQLTKASITTADCSKLLLYMSCMLIQIYLYCWYGNLVTTKSQDIAVQIFNVNWLDLNIDIKKNLLIMMKRTVTPISFVCLNILPVNLESFMSILKTSYSAYNLLQQTQTQQTNA